MTRYYSLNEYDCPADYYEAGNLGSVPPETIRRQRCLEAAERAREQEAVSREMAAYRELYGD